MSNSRDILNVMKSIQTKTFIEKAILVHDNKYDYSLADYVGTKIKVKIICNIHGTFEQIPNNHLTGNGCPKCANLNTAVLFIKKANLVHGEYDYSLVNYVRSTAKVIIRCKKHGIFVQEPRLHLTGQGCPSCGRAKSAHNWLKLYSLNEELGNEPGTFYKLLFTHKLGFRFIKVGITSRNIKTRYSHSKYKDFTYEIIEEINTTNLESALMEQEFMKNTKLKRFKFPENVKFTGYTECYEAKQ